MLAQLKSIHKSYGALAALVDVDLHIKSGEVVALLGPNGAGKSTAVALMLGLEAAQGGQAFLLGKSPHDLSARQGAGVMLQSAGIADSNKVRELLVLTRSYYPQPMPMGECIALAGLQEIMERRYGTLSGGQQRRVQFALAICGNPKVLFLDEPTTGLDIEAREGLWKAIRSLTTAGTGVLLTTHYLEEAEALANRVAVLHQGRIVAQGDMVDIRALVSQKRIRCLTHVPLDVIARWQGVASVQRDESLAKYTVILTEAPEPVLRLLLALDPQLAELEVSQAGLAEAFVQLTKTDSGVAK
jgi:ABC-2 type transport system ATP-binding protein